MTATSPRRSSRRFNAGTLWRGLAGVAGLVALLEIVSRSGIIGTTYLPPFDAVLWRALQLWVDPEFLANVGQTMLTYLLGMLIAAVIAIPLGIVFGLVNPVYRAARALIELIRPIPPVALIPLVLLALGNGLNMKLVIVVFAAVWPIMFNTLYGVHDVDPYQKEMGRSFGLGRFAIIRRIVIPAASPFIMTGVRIASSIALIVVITVELISPGGAKGIGAYIAAQQLSYQDSAITYLAVLAATITSGVLGLVVNLVIGWAERRWFAWDTTAKDGV